MYDKNRLFSHGWTNADAEAAESYDKAQSEYHVPDEKGNPLMDQSLMELKNEMDLQEQKMNEIYDQFVQLPESCREELLNKFQDLSINNALIK